MTQQARNNLYHTLQNILQGLIVLGVVGILKFVIDINNSITHSNDKILEHDKNIETQKNQIQFLIGQDQNHELRISILENDKNNKK